VGHYGFVRWICRFLYKNSAAASTAPGPRPGTYATPSNIRHPYWRLRRITPTSWLLASAAASGNCCLS
jgi:hypothetical protein